MERREKKKAAYSAPKIQSDIVHPIQRSSAPVNIYHCCIHKTGSQWISAILSDPVIFKSSGLKPFHHRNSGSPRIYRGRTLTERFVTEPIPKNTIVSPLYFGLENFLAMPKPSHYKAFFVMRDPRDIVVSYYFSMRYSHPQGGKVPERRELLRELSLADGIMKAIDILNKRGHFAALRSWTGAQERDPNVLLLRYEDMIGHDSFSYFKKLFTHCGIQLSDEMISHLLRDYSFERLSGGRQPGKEDPLSHFRKGISGDWKNYFILNAPDRATILREIENSDIVHLHFWNTPEMYEFLRSGLHSMRLLIKFNIGGKHPPHIITRDLIEFADFALTTSPEAHEIPVFQNLPADVRHKKTGMVFGATDFERLSGFKPRPHDTFNVGYIGTVDFSKMHPNYVSMSAQIDIPDVRFIVCGNNGQAFRDIRKQVVLHDAEERFDTRGYVEDIRSVIEILDVFGYPLCEDNYSTVELVLQAQ